MTKIDMGIQFLNVQIDSITYEELLEKVDFWLIRKEKRSYHIATINTYCVTLALKNKRLRQIYSRADIAGPDGEPFKKWMNYFNDKQTDKICARDVTLQLINHSKETEYKFYLYGGSPEVLERMADNLKIQFPHIRIIGYYSPPFRELTPEEDRTIINEINRLKPDIVLVGLGTPKQDYWIDDHIYEIKGTVFVTCGAIFDFFGGRVKMAPKYIQNSGFEWLYRLLSRDFKRLFYRYTILNIVFIWNFFLQVTNIKVFESVRDSRI
jgi:N-acetylglucosaminyldiphosphoundecaprenol N-acetyl-beta-D-mannosaminyltransferase